MSSDDMDDLTPQPAISPKLHQTSHNEMEIERWSQLEQTQFVEKMPMLHRDFTTVLPYRRLHHIVYKILSYLDALSLCRAEQVCMEWYQVIVDGMLWKELISWKVHIDPVWEELSERRGWGWHLTPQASPLPGINHQYFRRLYPCIMRDIQNLEENWRNGHHSLTKIECRDENSRGFNASLCDDNKIVGSLLDNTIKVWERHEMQHTRVLLGHTGPVVCFQYDEKVIITGSVTSPSEYGM